MCCNIFGDYTKAKLAWGSVGGASPLFSFLFKIWGKGVKFVKNHKVGFHWKIRKPLNQNSLQSTKGVSSWVGYLQTRFTCKMMRLPWNFGCRESAEVSVPILSETRFQGVCLSATSMWQLPQLVAERVHTNSRKDNRNRQFTLKKQGNKMAKTQKKGGWN